MSSGGSEARRLWGGLGLGDLPLRLAGSPCPALGLSGVGYCGTVAVEWQQSISAAVGINSADGWYPAGLDLGLCLPCDHAEPSEALLQGLSPSRRVSQPGGLQAFTRPYSRVSALDDEGVPGEVYARLYS